MLLIAKRRFVSGQVFIFHVEKSIKYTTMTTTMHHNERDQDNVQPAKVSGLSCKRTHSSDFLVKLKPIQSSEKKERER